MDPRNYSLVLAVGLALAAGGCTRGESVEQPAFSPAAAPKNPPRAACTRHFWAFDTSGDGRVSRAELFSQPQVRGDVEAVFDARDRDDDGFLTRDELCSGWRPGPPRAAAAEKQPRRGSGMTRVMHCDHHFAAFDENGDGKISVDELSVWPCALGDPVVVFEARDLNGDGAISETEFCSEWSRPLGPKR